MKRFITPLIIIAIIAGMLIVKNIFFPGQGSGGGPPAGQQGKMPPAIVQGMIAAPEPVDNSIHATGTVSASEAVELVTEASGRITSLNIREGARVSKGDLLLKINDAELQAQLNKVNHQIALARTRETRARQLAAIGGTSQEEVDIAVNEVQTLLAEINLIDAQIRKTELRAPFSGVIGLKSVSEGSYASPSARIATLRQSDPVNIDFTVPEKYASGIRTGDSIRFSLTGNPSTYRGRITAIEPQIDPVTRTLLLRAQCANPSGEIMPGAFASIELAAGRADSAILIPTQAIIPELKGKKVMVAKGAKAVMVPVETGERTAMKVAVISGLQPGDTVVLTGIMGLKPGSPVKVMINQEKK